MLKTVLRKSFNFLEVFLVTVSLDFAGKYIFEACQGNLPLQPPNLPRPPKNLELFDVFKGSRNGKWSKIGLKV